MKITSLSANRQTGSPAYGIFLILLSGLCFSLMALFVRLSKSSFRADTLVFYRSLIQVLVLLPWWKEYFPAGLDIGQKIQVHLIRGVFGILSMFFVYRAYQLLPLALVNQLTMTAVLWATLFSWWYLKEKVARTQAMFAGLTIVGVSLGLLSTESTGNWEWNTLGVTAALICGVSMGAAMTVLRKMRRELGSREIVFFFGWCGMLLTAPYLFVHPEVPRTAREIGYVLALGLSATAGQILMTSGFRYANTLTGTASKLPEMLFNVALGAIFLGENPPFLFFVGATIVIAGIVGLSLQKHSRGANAESVAGTQ